MKVKNIILKICITVLISFLVFYKPIYSIFIFLAFYTEYLHFFIFVSKCFKYKKSNDYYIIKMVEIKNNEDSLYEIWNKINEINAFKKVYLCFLKKKKYLLNQ